MHRSRSLLIRLANLFRRGRIASDLEEQLEAHRAMVRDDLIERGMTASDAEIESRKAVGNVTRIKELSADASRFRVLDDVIADTRYGLRALARTPGFAVAAIVTIALGIGTNMGIFSVLNGVFIRDLPAANADELVSISQTVQGGEFSSVDGGDTFTLPEYRAYRDRVQTLSGVLAQASPQQTTLGGDTPRKIFGAIVSCNYFDVIERPPVLGRALAAPDCAPGADPVIVLGYELWTTTFARDPGILGRTVELERHLFTVVGVAAEDTYSGLWMRAGYFAPLSSEPLLWPFESESRYEDDGDRWLLLVGRQSEGANLAEVRAELGIIAAQIDREQPGRSTTLTIARASRMVTLPAELRGAAMGAGVVLMTAFGLILLIACANVANLLLARGTTRSREIGIRLSLGASRARVVRQLLTESVLISIAGGLAGSILALWSFEAIVTSVLPRLMPPEFPGIALDLDLSPDFRVLSFAIAVTFGTSLLFGLAPAWHVSRPDLDTVIKQDAAGSGESRRGARLRGALVGVQVALSMMLMIATGLLLRGLYTAHTIDPGFNYRDVSHLSFGTADRPDILDQRLMNEVAALPGVEAVAFSTRTPLGGQRLIGVPVHVPGREGNAVQFVETDSVTSGYFSLLDIPIVRGRTFTDAEIANSDTGAESGSVIVSATTARNLWGRDDPIGETLIRGDDFPLQVVGVAADAQLSTLGTIDDYHIYLPRQPGGELLVRSRADFSATASGIREIVMARDSSLAFRVLPLEANIGWFRGVSGTVATLGGSLGVLALVLTAVGIYGVVSYAVTRRYREIGIRMALGAGPRHVYSVIIRQTMRPVVVGAVLGLAGAVGLSRILSAVLFGVSSADLIGFAGAVLLVLSTGFLASMVPIRSGLKRDPVATLRHD